MTNEIDVKKGNGAQREIAPTRQGEFSDLKIDVGAEVHTFDDNTQQWNRIAQDFTKAVIALAQNTSNKTQGASGTAVLAEVNDTIGSLFEHGEKSELVNFTSKTGETIYALRLSVSPQGEIDELSEEDAELFSEFGLEPEESSELSFYFPVQESVVFANLSYYASDFLSMGFLNDFQDYELDYSGTLGGEKWVLSARQVAGLMGI